MLCRFASVSPEGAYQAPPPANQKAAYAALTSARAIIVEETGWYMAKSVTIAVGSVQDGNSLTAARPCICP